MNKKETLIQLLQELEDSWELAPGLRILVEQTEEDSDIITGLLTIIEKSITSVKDDATRARLEVLKTKLQGIQAQEQVEKASREQEAQGLLNNMF